MVFSSIGKKEEVCLLWESKLGMEQQSSQKQERLWRPPCAMDHPDPASFDEAAYTAQVLEMRQNRESVVFAAVFSPCGAYLISASSLGKINVWGLAKYLVRGPRLYHIKPLSLIGTAYIRTLRIGLKILASRTGL